MSKFGKGKHDIERQWARHEHASRLHKQGLTFREIGRRLDISGARAGRLCRIFEKPDDPHHRDFKRYLPPHLGE